MCCTFPFDGYYSILASLGWLALIVINSNSWVVVVGLGDKHDLIGIVFWWNFLGRSYHVDLIAAWWSNTSGD